MIGVTMEDKCGLFFFKFLIPFALGGASLCGILTATGKERAATILLLFPLFAICVYYLYINTLELFRNLRNRK